MTRKYQRDKLTIITWQRATAAMRMLIAETKQRIEASGMQAEVVERFEKHPERSLRYKQENFTRPFQDRTYMPQVKERI